MPNRWGRIYHVLLSLLLGTGLLGCQSITYYGHVIHGQLNILNRRQPINQLVNDPQTPAELKEKLELVLRVRDFAKNELHLPVNNHYLSYADLKRPYAVWSVFAAPEFSLTPKTWCYPVVGCAAYRGYFSAPKARRYADRLQQQGYDVYISGAVAYSTLGWFDDPVLNTFIHRDDDRLAALIFHELAHQVLYVLDDTTFNESFATAVEQEGLRRWLEKNENSQGYEAYMTEHRRHQQFIQLVMKYRRQLESLYRNDLPPAEKRPAKGSIFDTLRGEYAELKQQWNGFSGFDFWFRQPLSNAHLVPVSTYYDWVPAFLDLLQNVGGDLKQFYERCQSLAQAPKEKRQRMLTQPDTEG
jgi:predicted aminopeptidase